MRYKSILKYIIGFVILLANLAQVSFALPINIAPKVGYDLPTSVNPGSAVNAYYTLTNNTAIFRNGIHIKYLPPNVSQVVAGETGLCTGSFALASQASCTLKLSINGAVVPNETDPQKNIFACFIGDKVCAGTTSRLNVKVNNVPAHTLSAIAVSPVSVSIPKTTTQNFTATGSYLDGTTANITSDVTWVSTNTAVATITSIGVATALSAGSTSIQANLNTISSNSAAMTVTAAPLQSITISPTSSSIAKGLTQSFTATGNYADGSTANITSSVNWSSSNPSIAAINTSGVATGVGVGSSVITASLSGVSSSGGALTITAAVLQSINILPTSAGVAKGLTQSFTATGTYSDGTTANLTTSATWSSSNTAIATIASTGIATGVGVGVSNIQASLNSVSSNFATLTITAPVLQTIAITPTSSSIFVGSSQQYVATGFYSDGTTTVLTNLATWVSSNTAAASINTTGFALGVGAGSTAITATYQSVVSNSANLGVTAVTLSSIAVTPTTASTSIGGTQQFTATGTYSDSSTANITSTVTWSSSNPAIATINSAGLATLVASGQVNISASSGSVVSNNAVFSLAQFAFISNSLSNNVLSCPINSNGSLGTCTPKTVSTSPYSIGIGTTTAGTFVYVGLFNTNISYCPLSATGVIGTCAVTGSGSIQAVRGITFAKIGATQYAYLTTGNSPGNNLYYCPVVDNTGNLGACNTTGISGTNSIGGTHLTINGNDYFYFVNVNGSQIYYCLINPTNGTLSACTATATGATYNNLRTISSVVINGNSYVHVAGSSGNVYQCSVNSDGSLGASGVCSSLTLTGGASGYSTIGTVNNNEYLVTTSNSAIYCPINTDGSFGSCLPSGANGIDGSPTSIVFH